MIATSLTLLIVFYRSWCGAMALAGLSITFPFMNLGAAFGSLVGVERRDDVGTFRCKRLSKCRKILGNLVLLNVITGFLFSLVCLILDPILYFWSKRGTLPYARDFMKILLYGNIITTCILD